MKKIRIMVLAILLIIVIGFSAAYFIYGSTLIDIKNEKSINNHLAADPEKPITMLKTEKVGNYFGILYKDPLNEDYDYTFRYITKSPFYKNRYYNTLFIIYSFQVFTIFRNITIRHIYHFLFHFFF